MALPDINLETALFIRQNLKADVLGLALGHVPNGVDLKTALTQIAGYRAAFEKLPDWAAHEDLRYPVHLSMEQSTSQALALYKAKLVKDWLEQTGSQAAVYRFADLTGGLGVDCVFLSTGSTKCIYNEMNPELCNLARHNFPLLDRPDIVISNMDAGVFLDSLEPDSFDILYLDPARRDSSGHKLVSIHDCSPDVTQMHDRLFEASKRVLIKLSPMLDIKKVLSELECVARVMAISLAGECKELLVFLERDFQGETLIQAVDIDRDGHAGQVLESTLERESATVPTLDANGSLLTSGNYLYEPCAAVMKSGLFNTLAHKYSVSQVGQGSHLYVSNAPIESFPGRGFVIDNVLEFDRHTAKTFFNSISSANIAVRNFPMTSVEIRQRFKVRDGGNHYVFATTATSKSSKVLIDCHKS